MKKEDKDQYYCHQSLAHTLTFGNFTNNLFSGNGYLTWKEFCAYMKAIFDEYHNVDPEQDLKDAFKMFEGKTKDGKGTGKCRRADLM